jgi:hypothetical protein
MLIVMIIMSVLKMYVTLMKDAYIMNLNACVMMEILAQMNIVTPKMAVFMSISIAMMETHILGIIVIPSWVVSMKKLNMKPLTEEVIKGPVIILN